MWHPRRWRLYLPAKGICGGSRYRPESDGEPCSMFNKKRVDILSQMEVFKGLARDDLKGVAKGCQRIRFEKGDTLIEMGDPPAALYVLVKGRLKVVLPQRLQGRRERRASEVTLNILNQGACFGEYSLIEKRPASASVVAADEGEVLKLERVGFEQFMTNDRIARTVYGNLLHILIGRLRKKEEELDLVLIAG